MAKKKHPGVHDDIDGLSAVCRQKRNEIEEGLGLRPSTFGPDCKGAFKEAAPKRRHRVPSEPDGCSALTESQRARSPLCQHHHP